MRQLIFKNIPLFNKKNNIVTLLWRNLALKSCQYFQSYYYFLHFKTNIFTASFSPPPPPRLNPYICNQRGTNNDNDCVWMRFFCVHLCPAHMGTVCILWPVNTILIEVCTRPFTVFVCVCACVSVWRGADTGQALKDVHSQDKQDLGRENKQGWAITQSRATAARDTSK